MRLAWNCSLGAALVVLAFAPPAVGSGPVIWRQSGTDMAAGDAVSVTVTADGQLRLAPASELLFDTRSPRIWAMEVAADGAVYLAVGEAGEVFRVAQGGAPERFFAGPQLGAQAMAIGPDGHLYVATGPRGSVYRVPRDHDGGSIDPWFTPEATYVWALAFDSGGDLYVATGGPGRILRVDEEGNGEVFYETSETHVRALVTAPGGGVYAGTAENGYVLRIGPDGDVFAMFDAPLAEITALVVDGDELWVGAFGGEAAASPGPPGGDAAVVVTGTGSANGASAAAAGGAIYRLRADGFAETAWSSTSAGVHTMAAFGSGVIAGTGPDGELVSVSDDDRSSMLARLGAAQVVALRPTHDGDLLAATSNLGRVYWLREGFRESGEYLSQVKDTQTSSRWGQIRWRADAPEGTSVQIFSRSGNTGNPDDTWSEWAGPYTRAEGSAIASPPARFLQWRAVLTSSDTRVSPVLYRVEAAYVSRNMAPAIEQFTVHPAGVVYRQTASFEDGLPFAQLPQPVARQLREENGGQSAGAAAAGRAFLGRPFYIAGLRTLTWQAADSNGDELRSALEYRGEDERAWKPLARELAESLHTFDTRRLPDGAYVARLTVDDGVDNAVEAALESHATSRAFVVDNTPPVLAGAAAEPDGTAVRVTAAATDATSLIARLQYSVDGADWRTVVPADGLADSSSERFDFVVAGLGTGEHTIVLRATDTALNSGAGKLVVEVH